MVEESQALPCLSVSISKAWCEKYYEWLGEFEETVKKSNKKVENITEINPGDWVTISRKYAKEHGQAHLRNKYKILSKKVRAKEIFTEGNSLNEWGYAP